MLAWLLVNAVVLLALLAWVYGKFGLNRVGYSRFFSKDAVFAGEEIEMVERIANRKLLPLPWVRLESMMAQGLVFGPQHDLDIRGGERFQNHISLFSLRSYRQIVRRHRVVCAKRGYYVLDSATMTAGDPVGLTRPSRRFPLSLTLTVYPEVVPMRDVPLPAHSWLGDVTVRRWIVEDPFLTAGTREYRSGDALRSVNWKATARTGRLQVHRNDYTADHRLMICVNLETHDRMWNAVLEPGRIERALSYAASVAVYATRQGVETGLLSNGWTFGGPKQPVRLAPGGGEAQLTALLEAMAKLQLETSVTMHALLDDELAGDPSDTDYLIVTCHRGAELEERVDALRRRGNGVEWLYVEGEGGRRG